MKPYSRILMWNVLRRKALTSIHVNSNYRERVKRYTRYTMHAHMPIGGGPPASSTSMRLRKCQKLRAWVFVASNKKAGRTASAPLMIDDFPGPCALASFLSLAGAFAVVRAHSATSRACGAFILFGLGGWPLFSSIYRRNLCITFMFGYLFDNGMVPSKMDYMRVDVTSGGSRLFSITPFETSLIKSDWLNYIFSPDDRW